MNLLSEGKCFNFDFNADSGVEFFLQKLFNYRLYTLLKVELNDDLLISDQKLQLANHIKLTHKSVQFSQFQFRTNYMPLIVVLGILYLTLTLCQKSSSLSKIEKKKEEA